MDTKKTLLVTLTSATMFLVLFWLLATAVPPAYTLAIHEGINPSLPIPHAPESTIRYVAPTGSDSGDCTVVTSPCRTVQYAVDQAAEGDEIRVATGTYTDIHARSGITQVVYISKTVTVRGGYSADFSAWDPAQYATTLDAQSAGRVFYIIGDITTTLEGLSLTHGDAVGLGGGRWGDDAGGGVYVMTATIAISNCRIVNSSAYYGGGLFLWDSNNATLTGNQISNNTAERGGGVELYYSNNATLTGNQINNNAAARGGGLELYYSNNTTLTHGTIMSNTTTSHGGGLYMSFSSDNTTLTNNTITNNSSGDDGGGIFATGNNTMLMNNTIMGNTASDKGGGLYLYLGKTTLTNNTIVSNTASNGGALYLLSNNADLQNDIIADNVAENDGGGLYVQASSSVLRHLTLARNSGSTGIYVTEYAVSSSYLVMTNTILVSHTVGLSVTSGSTATVQATLWGSGKWANGTDYGGEGTIITGTVNVRGDPAFVDPDAGNYHILSTSAAVNAGVDAGVTTDIDGDTRPSGLGYDIGADEYLCHALATVTISGPITGNIGTAYTFNATISPTDASTPISYTWTPAPQSGQGTATTTYTWTTTGTHTITVTAENCGGVVTARHTIAIASPKYAIYLPLVLRNR